MILRPATTLADVALPDPLTQKADVPSSSSPHLSPAFVCLAVFASLLVAYLLWDLYRQKRDERRERQRLERFREKKLNQVPPPA
jgi:hypothetical protein